MNATIALNVFNKREQIHTAKKMSLNIATPI